MTEAEIIELNNNFYRQVAPFFDQTRLSPWAGWEKLPLPKNGADVLDVACGNLRFYKFLQSKNLVVNYLGVDTCKELLNLSQTENDCFEEIDLLKETLAGDDWRKNLPRQKYDYVLCSAFFHHLPNRDWRREFLRQLWELTANNGGILIISLWQFMNDKSLVSKIVAQDLGGNDYLLEWKKGVTAYRFCHHFDEAEIAEYVELIKKWGMAKIEEFKADGATHAMNHYLVIQKA